jgi:hypothetical protein
VWQQRARRATANRFAGKTASEIPALKSGWGKPPSWNFRGGNGNVGIIRSPVHTIALPDGRNFTDGVEGSLNGNRYSYMIAIRCFTAEFLSTLAEAGVASVKLPPRSLI